MTVFGLRMRDLISTTAAHVVVSATVCAAPSFTPLGTGSSASSVARAVSDDGSTVAGETDFPAPFAQDGGLAFRWTAATGLVELPAPDAAGNDDERAWGFAIAGDGSTIVGRGRRDSINVARLYWSADNAIQSIPLPFGDPTFNSNAFAVNGDGTIMVGEDNNGQGSRPWIYDTQTEEARRLPAFPGDNNTPAAQPRAMSADASVIVGFGKSDYRDSRWRAIKWVNESVSVIEANPSYSVFAYETNDDGSAIVGYRTGSAGTEALAWYGGVAPSTVLPDLPGGDLDSRAWGVTNDGRVVAGQAEDASGRIAVLWIDGADPALIADVLQDAGVDLMGYVPSIAFAITPDGRFVVGSARRPSDGQEEAFIAELPPLFPPCSPADLSGDGNLNNTDINLFVSAFLAMDPAADFNSDNNWNNTDINLFVQAFLAGCG